MQPFPHHYDVTATAVESMTKDTATVRSAVAVPQGGAVTPTPWRR